MQSTEKLWRGEAWLGNGKAMISNAMDTRGDDTQWNS